MKITVQGRSGRGRPWVARAGRFWPTDAPRLVEVVDTEDDPPAVKVMVRNPTTNRDEPQLRPDPDRIGQRSYRAIDADSRLSIKQTDTVNAGALDAAMAAAHEEVARLSRENLELKANLAAAANGDALVAALEKITELTKERDGLKADLDLANEIIAEVKTTAPVVEVTGETQVADKKGAAKKA